ncbi:hypothetical protein NW766_010700 [Fusarium irregulare]|uniref:Uncharacterized protein n=1 Tax=Fusarium irregulare TaxID=2494466 RepID=A0A9W8U6E6_9HYPO|nr:hypothetical protein NW766_010700 [Fusarium irregulare]
MRTPQNVYQENYHAIRKRLDDELRQLMQCQDNPSSYERGADALFQLAGEIKELEIQYRQSVTSMEQDYRERLDVAHKRLACGMIDAFGDIIFDPCVQDKFRQALAHQKLAIETDSIREEHNIAQDTHTDPQTDTDLDEHERVMTHMALDEHASLESQSTGGGARVTRQPPNQNQFPRGVEISGSCRTSNTPGNPDQQAIATSETNAPQLEEPSLHVRLTMEKSLVSQTISVSRTSPAPEASTCSETNMSSEASVD